MSTLEADLKADIERCSDAYYNGNHYMLFEAIRRCAQYQITPPDWIRFELEAGLKRWNEFEAKEFGEAFGITRENGKHDNAEKKRKMKAWPLYEYVRKLHEENGERIDKELFTKAGIKFAIGATLASEYYYDVKRVLQAISDEQNLFRK